MQQSPSQYRQELAALANRIPAFEELRVFLETSQKLDASPATISRIRFNDNSATEFTDIAEANLSKCLRPTQSSDLFVIENVSAHVIELLGSQFDVEFDFWLEHVSNSNWFRLGDIEKHLPALKSVRLDSRHTRHRFIGPRELLLKTPVQFVKDRIEPEAGSARVPRVAGALNPLERLPNRSHKDIWAKERFPPLALTRQHVSMWFDANEGSAGWNLGIILLDPPFRPERDLGECQNPAYRSFVPRPQTQSRLTYHLSLISCLKQDKNLQNGRIPCPFVVLGDMYRIIASEWIVVNTSLQRELNTIEWNIENEDARLERLHAHLNSLYTIRRRVTLYQVLIKEQREACRQHGRRYWDRSPSAGTNTLALENVTNTLEMDFAFVADQVAKNQERVSKNVSLLMALISVAESRIMIANGRRVEALALAAFFLVPFSLVSSVMNINGDLRMGGPRQYVFWVVSVPFSAVLGLGYMLYSRSWVS
ncbi:hypothetical protein K458DRAFT_86478 [Lentithecium fluviatile CBS 122367]|uniref:Cora-domain-containing protein n=1 Tax=Lentithecium fluviatile CBS 122367 TaxID=1168545 RepID=A0A6G1IS92_9PLEO|nr:hypothetical protein K458DRAFT_86478 [Lentithecium fluviatile CBS 122367]